MNILIVDDHEENLYLQESLLKASGHDVRQAVNGEEALRVLQAEGIDLIISDILMPVMDGFQLCRKVKTDARLRAIPFIIYTATYTGPKDQEFALRIGADRFIEKPCEPEVFMAAVNEVLAAAGRRETETSPVPVHEEEVLRLYSERLVRKLEQKMVQAEREIQTRQEAEKALVESKDRLIAAQRIARMGDFIWDAETGEVTWSDALFDLLHYEKSETIDYAMVHAKIIHPEDRERITRWLNNCIASGTEELTPNEYRLIRKDGQILYVRAVGVIQQRPGRKPRIFATVQDITQRKQAEDALRESESRFRLFADLVPVGVIIADQDQKAVYANRKFFDLFGYTLADIPSVEAWFLRAYPDESLRNHVRETWQAAIEEARRTRSEIRPMEFAVTCKDGTVRDIEFRLSTTSALDFVVFTDMTNRNQMNKERENLKTQLFQAQKMESVGRLAGGVAHDFNNMLSIIIGYAEFAMENVQPDELLHADLVEIMKAAERSKDITRQLLAFARQQTIAPKVLNLNDAIESMLKMLRRLIGEDIDLAWLPGAEPWAVKIDPSQVDQILANLCVNARDAIVDVGKVTIETKNISFDADYCAVHAGFHPGEYVLLAVSDDGRGIAPENLDKIFEPFFSTKGVGKGTGLGLATIYGIVKQNNGFINVYSEPGKGTTFRIYLPRYTGSTDTIQEEGGVEIPRGKGELVLLVEDNQAIMEMSRRMLEKLGYQVLEAGTPGEALRLADEHAGTIHLVITDVVMPEMNGRDLSDRLHALYPDLKILFMSGYTANVIAHRGVLDDGVHYIQKPFSQRDLAVKVRQALES